MIKAVFLNGEHKWESRNIDGACPVLQLMPYSLPIRQRWVEQEITVDCPEPVRPIMYRRHNIVYGSNHKDPVLTTYIEYDTDPITADMLFTRWMFR